MSVGHASALIVMRRLPFRATFFLGQISHPFV
jgi:hypothetical protein